MFLIPIAYLIFISRMVTISIGRQTLWVSFVILSAIIAIINLVVRREVQPEETAVELKYPTRLQTWINTVRRKERNLYFKWNLAQDLSNLFIEAIAYHQGSSRQQVRQQLEAGQIDLPPDVLAYLQISQMPFAQTGIVKYTNGNWLMRVWRTIIRRPSANMYNSPLDLDYEKIIPYLEEYLNFDAEVWEE
jgi:hypothetical protein